MLKVIKISLSNLLNKKFSSLLLIVFLSFGFSIFLFLEIGKSYLENLTNTIYSGDIGDNKLIIEKNNSTISSFLSDIVNKKDYFKNSEIEKISNIDGIKKVYKGANFNEPAIMSINLLGNYFTTDIFLEGLDESIFNKKFENFNDKQNYIPLIVSNKVVSSLIAIFVKDKSAEKITKELILGKEFNIVFGKSSLTKSPNKGLKMKGKIVGFGEGSNFMLISIPYSWLKKINLSLGKKTKVQKLFLETDKNTDIDKLEISIKNLGYTVKNNKKEKEKIKSLVKILYKIGFLFVSIILLIITYSLISFLILRIIESKKDNSIMFAIGITRQKITMIYIIEGFIISIFGLILSLLIIYLSIYYLNSYIGIYNSNHNFINLPDIDFRIQNLVLLIIFFIIINTISISLSYFKILKSDFKKII
ncbi:hypothetical protein CSA08_02205 [Candidatus Gracilibacteria bacterium]|nr:MAG: hypothetical protein CSA08_02205 [Candidatus Gracilibacteria bacterium]